VSDLLEGVRAQIRDRLEALRPAAIEEERLEAASPRIRLSAPVRW
jgi:hypothetical protein